MNKRTTGLAGIPVHPRPRDDLISIYTATLAELQKCPTDAVYRTQTEALTTHRLNVVKSTESITDIERAIDAGQIEEVLIEAQDELDLAAKMVEWKPWEELQEKPAADQWTYFDNKK
eukprot:Partr_v1_DN27228_c3_g1_i5_m39128 putative NADH dehydrogenase (Ubiquinone) 1 alpha subcomplex